MGEIVDLQLARLIAKFRGRVAIASAGCLCARLQHQRGQIDAATLEDAVAAMLAEIGLAVLAIEDEIEIYEQREAA